MSMPSSGSPISLGDARTTFGDSGDTSMSELYRGGSLIPATRDTTTTTYGAWSSYVFVIFNESGGGFPTGSFSMSDGWLDRGFQNIAAAQWSGVGTIPSSNLPPAGTTLIEGGGYQYERGVYQGTSGTAPSTTDYYSVRRRSVTTTTTSENINTGVPTTVGSQISMNQLYGTVAS